MTRRDWTRREEDLCRFWRHQDVKVATIAKRLARTPGSVRRKLSALGVVLHPRTWRKGMYRRVARLLHAGMTVTDVCTRLDANHAYVSRVRKREGIPPATRSQRVKASWVFRAARGDKPPNRWAKREKSA